MKLQRGINLGGYLSQCDHSAAHYEAFIHAEDLSRIARWGYDHVRLPVDSEVLENPDGSEKASGYQLIDRLLGWCAAEHLFVVLDLHKVAGYDFNDANDAQKNNLFQSEALQKRFLSLWQHIATHYGTRKDVVFELLNEVVETENAEAWNELIDRAVKAIRGIAPKTPIMYGGIQWNSARRLPQLRAPQDENIIFTFHYYEPLLFTHQKAPWVPAMNPNETISYPNDMDWYRAHSLPLGQQGLPVAEATSDTMGPAFHEEMLREAIQYAKKVNVPLYCGEFGVIDRAPVPDTLRWFQDIGTLFAKYDIGFAIWSYREMDFGITEPHYAPIYRQIVHLR